MLQRRPERIDRHLVLGDVVFRIQLRRVRRLADHVLIPEADKAFIDELSSKLPATVAVTSVDCHINDEAFAETILARFLSMMEKEEK